MTDPIRTEPRTEAGRRLIASKGVCGYEFVGVGTRCLTREDHPIHRGLWEGVEPAHRFEPFERRSGRDRRAAL